MVTVMPVVARDLHGLSLYGWAFSSFMLAILVGIVLAGRDADRHGPARPYVAGLVLFASGLVVGGLAPSMWVLVVGRCLQGLGAGAVPAVAYVAIGRSLPEALRARMMAVLSTAWVVPGIVGPGVAAAVSPPLRLALGLPRAHPPGRRGRADRPPRPGPPGPAHAAPERRAPGGRRGAHRGRGGAGAGRARGARPWLGVLLAVAGVAGGPCRPAPSAPGGHPAGAPRAARHHLEPRAADLRLLRGRCLRDVDHHDGAAPQHDRRRWRRHRFHPGLDRGLVGPGPRCTTWEGARLVRLGLGLHPRRHRRHGLAASCRRAPLGGLRGLDGRRPRAWG